MQYPRDWRYYRSPVSSVQVSGGAKIGSLVAHGGMVGRVRRRGVGDREADIDKPGRIYFRGAKAGYFRGASERSRTGAAYRSLDDAPTHAFSGYAVSANWATRRTEWRR